MKKIFSLLIVLICLLWSGLTLAADTPVFGLEFGLTLTDCSSIIEEGRACYDTDDDVLYIGNGIAAVAIAGTGDITAVGSCLTGSCATIGNGATSAGYLDFLEDSNNGSNYARIIAPASTANVVLTLPAETGTVCSTGSVCTGYQASLGYTPVNAADWTTINSYPTGCTNQLVTTIGDTLTCSSVAPAMLPQTGITDEYCLTYEATGTTMEWQVCLSAEVDGSVTNELPTAGTYIDVSGTDVTFDPTEILDTTWGASADTSQVWTWDTGAGTDPNVTVTDSAFTFNKQVIATGGIQSGSSATPTIVWKDSDAADGDENSTMGVNCTDTGSGTEDCDITLSTQIAGAITSVMSVDADGNTNFSLPVSFGTAGVLVTGDGDGAVTLLGLGNGSDEDLTINLDDTSNTVVFSSSTGVTDLNFSALNLVTTGYMAGGVKLLGTFASPITSTGVYSLAAANTYNTFIFYNDTDEIQLPTGVAGMNLCIYVAAATLTQVGPQDADVIVVDGTANAAGDAFTVAAAAGNYVCLVSDAAGHWVTVGAKGTLTAL